MARRKSRATGSRKNNATQSDKKDKRLQDDPGGKNRHQRQTSVTKDEKKPLISLPTTIATEKVQNQSITNSHPGLGHVTNVNNRFVKNNRLNSHETINTNYLQHEHTSSVRNDVSSSTTTTTKVNKITIPTPSSTMTTKNNSSNNRSSTSMKATATTNPDTKLATNDETKKYQTAINNSSSTSGSFSNSCSSRNILNNNNNHQHSTSNHNNNSNRNPPSSDDLKYLHKKFKRIASATYDVDNDDKASTFPISSSSVVSRIVNDGIVAAAIKESQQRTASLSCKSRENSFQVKHPPEEFDLNRNPYLLANGTAKLSQSESLEHNREEDPQIHLESFTYSNESLPGPERTSGPSCNYSDSSSHCHQNSASFIGRQMSATQDNLATNLSQPGTTFSQAELTSNGDFLQQTNKSHHRTSTGHLSTQTSSFGGLQQPLENQNQQPPSKFSGRYAPSSLLPHSTTSGHYHIQQQQQVQNSQQQQRNSVGVGNISTSTTSVTIPLAINNDQIDQNFSGRFVCPYCNLNCTKPSVLQKHIRAHTNERPYPCDTCGFAFKTKSNYYKHCRSRAHSLRVKGGEPTAADEDISMGSDQDPDPELSNSSCSDVISRTASPIDDRVNSPAVHNQLQFQQQKQQHQYHHNQQRSSTDKPYKPKFHKAALYVKEELSQQRNSQQHHNHNSLQQQIQQSTTTQQNSSSHSNTGGAVAVNHQSQSYFPQNRHLPSISQLPLPPSSQQQNPSHEIHEECQDQTLHYLHPVRNLGSSSSSRQEQPTPTVLMATQGQSQKQFQQVITMATTTTTATTTPLLFQSSASSSMESINSCITQDSRRQSTGSITSAFVGGNVGSGGQLNVEFLQEHISKIISQNEAIVENKEILLQKKYPKMSNKKIQQQSASLVSGSEASSNSAKLSLALAQKQQQEGTHLQRLQREDSTEIRRSSGNNPGPAGILIPLSVTKFVNNLQPNSSLYQSQTQADEVMHVSAAQPLNLTKICENPIEYSRKRSCSDGFLVPLSETATTAVVSTPTKSVAATHPQNPERSIIKHLLLNARGLGVPNGEGEDAVYICPLCENEFRTAEDLRLHTSSYCQGGPSSAPISPVGSPSLKYFRSSSLSVNLPELNSPNSLAKIARSTLLLSKNPLPLAKLAWSQLKVKPSNLVLNQLNININPTQPSTSASSSHVSTSGSSLKAVENPLPSPGPLLGKTPLVDSYNNKDRRSDDVIITKVHEEGRTFSPKRLKFDSYTQHTFVPLSNSSQPIQSSNFEQPPKTSSPMKPSYSMCGGDMKLLDKKDERMKRFFSSGGCIIPISECPDTEMSPKMIRTPLLSGGSFTEVSPKSKDSTVSSANSSGPPSTPKMMIPVTPLTPIITAPSLLNPGLPLTQHFQFPPINSITAFNPLTLPPVATMGSLTPSSVMHGDKLIPFVPGIPGPNSVSLSSALPLPLPPQNLIIDSKTAGRNVSPSRMKTPNPVVMSAVFEQTPPPRTTTQHLQQQQQRQFPPPRIRIETDNSILVQTMAGSNDYTRSHRRSPRSWIPAPSTTSTGMETPKKPFNFMRMADNISPLKKIGSVETSIKRPDPDTRPYNLEIMITKSEIVLRPLQPVIVQSQQLSSMHCDITAASTSLTSGKEGSGSEFEIAEAKSKAKAKFLRPTSLPLKPGTFTPKRHHGITPTANTLPLISPETPRPSKACIQLYLNGHAYTYLGLKCSTKMFYCTVNCPQASYVAGMQKLSMYSVWQTCAENNPHPLGLKPKQAMSLYNSYQRSSSNYAVAKIQSTYDTVRSQATVMTPFENNQGQFYHHQVKLQPIEQLVKGGGGRDESKSRGLDGSDQSLVGGYESNENYTYIRGRGRGRYVCSECGIRCKKPSMLKKHIRTHTDVRPYHCKHCSFSFKTKGNLTKHMQSKTHYKRCLELGINPGPMPPMDGDYTEGDNEIDSQSVTSGGGRTPSLPEETDSDDFSDGGDGETESSDTDESKSRLPEHEAARCLLSLSMTPPSNSLSPHMFNSRCSQMSASGELYSPSHRLNSDCGEVLSYGQPISSRRVISFTSPKPPFDYQKQEQYYSNPSILPKEREEKLDETSMKPIDLTKPRRQNHQLFTTVTNPANSPRPKVKLSDVIGEQQSESSFLRSLVSITDKVRTSVPSFVRSASSRVNENVLLQAYLTEQALQYTKIKQSQMSSNFLAGSNNSTFSNCTTVSSNASICYSSATQTKMSVSSSEISVLDNNASLAVETVDNTDEVVASAKVRMSPVAESINTIESSARIEAVTEPDEHPVFETEPITAALKEPTEIPETVSAEAPITTDEQSASHAAPSRSVGAKSVASEYLKRTSAEYLKCRASSKGNDESEESGSETEATPPTTIDGVHKTSSGLLPVARTLGDGFKNNSTASNSSNEVQPMFPRGPISEDGRPVCTICSKSFQKQHQLVLHMNIHYMERKFKCEPCAVSFRTQGHLQKHERSEAHKIKVMMTSTFGVPTTSNPRPFECADCVVAFRIHGHLAKHLRSKTHVQKLECLQKLPFGTYAEIERAGISLTEIDTTDCDNSLASLKVLAQKLMEKDPSKLGTYTNPCCIEGNSSGAISHESGGEDSPDTQTDCENLTSINSSSDSATIVRSIGIGIKRKFESISANYINETISSSAAESSPKQYDGNQTILAANNDEIGTEKRARTISISEI